MDAEAQLNFTCPPFVHLESAFLAMEPPDCLISLARVCGGGSVTEKVQRFIWDNCISKPDGNFYAPYLKRFLKKLIVEVESTGSDVLDELYETYASYMTSLKDDDSSKGNSRILKWVSFLFPDDCSRVGTCLRSRKLVIPLQCSLNLLEGDTGCSIWPSSLFLSEFILSSPEIFSSKSCFEVGSGVGLVGICLAHVGASKVILSDGDLSSLANMKLNLELNKLGFRTNLLEATTQEKTNLVQCKYLAWESAPENELQDLVPDMVLGADVIYNPSCIPHLIRVLALLLHRGKSDFDHSLQNGKIHNKPEPRKIHGDLEKPDLSDNNSLLASTKGPVAYIACVIRNIDTFNYFLRQAEEANLVVTDITGEIRRLNLLPYMQSYPSADAMWALTSVASDFLRCHDIVLDHGALIPLLAQFNEHTKLPMLGNVTWALSIFYRSTLQPPFEQTRLALPALNQLVNLNDEEVLIDTCWVLSIFLIASTIKFKL